MVHLRVASKEGGMGREEENPFITEHLPIIQSLHNLGALVKQPIPKGFTSKHCFTEEQALCNGTSRVIEDGNYSYREWGERRQQDGVNWGSCGLLGQNPFSRAGGEVKVPPRF